MNNGTGLSAQAVKALAIVGVVAILLIGMWGVIQAVRILPNVFSLLASGVSSTETLTAEVDSLTVKNGVPFALRFSRSTSRGEGTYVVSYACRDGVTFTTPNASGVYQEIPCDTAFAYTGATGEVRLIPFSSRNRFIDVPVTVRYVRSSTNEASSEDSVLLTIENDKLSGSPSVIGSGSGSTGGVIGGGTSIGLRPGPQTSSTYTFSGGGAVSNPAGKPDLAVRILEIGTLDTVTNAFIKTTSVLQNGRGAVRFAVENLGTKTSPSWSFTAALPTYPFHVYQSTSQQPLAPGERIEYTIGFDSVSSAVTAGVFTVNVDPSNSIWEVSESNNIAKVTLPIIH